MIQALLAAAIIFGVLAVWVGVMHLARKAQNLPPDCDVMGDTGQGCAQCSCKNICAIVEEADASAGSHPKRGDAR